MYYNNKRMALSFFWIVTGAVLLILSVMEILDSTVYAGLGGGLLAVGVMQVRRQLRYRKDEEYREKVDIEIGDERIKYIRLHAWAWTGYIIVLGEAVGSVIALVIGQELIMHVLAESVCAIMLVYWVSYILLSRKY